MLDASLARALASPTRAGARETAINTRVAGRSHLDVVVGEVERAQRLVELHGLAHLDPELVSRVVAIQVQRVHALVHRQRLPSLVVACGLGLHSSVVLGSGLGVHSSANAPCPADDGAGP